MSNGDIDSHPHAEIEEADKQERSRNLGSPKRDIVLMKS
jgi:hypothetical protein